jgi:hypothetical protein
MLGNKILEKTKEFILNPLFHLVFVLIVLNLIHFYYLTSAQGKRDILGPTSGPHENFYPPIDSGTTTQIKEGNLIVGSTSDQGIGLLGDIGGIGYYKSGTLRSWIVYNPGEGNLVFYGENDAGSITSSTISNYWFYDTTTKSIYYPNATTNLALIGIFKNNNTLPSSFLGSYPSLYIANNDSSFNLTNKATSIYSSQPDQLIGFSHKVNNWFSFFALSGEVEGNTGYITNVFNFNRQQIADISAIFEDKLTKINIQTSTIIVGDVKRFATSSGIITIEGPENNKRFSSYGGKYTWGARFISSTDVFAVLRDPQSFPSYDNYYKNGYFITGLQLNSRDNKIKLEFHRLFPKDY